MKRIELINTIIQKNKYQSYLEIGVNTIAQPGYSHDSITIPLKHGVDPNVDTTYKMTSDEFFKNHISRKYDIVFVDGLHIFDQAYRDIINALEHLEDNGTIVVHDCNPTKEITQRPIRASSVWHGDVWKAILKLRMEKPDISIVTVDTDEGCGIIKKGKQDLFTTTIQEDKIYTFDFFNKHRKEILNLISIKDFKKQLGIKNSFSKIFEKLLK